MVRGAQLLYRIKDQWELRSFNKNPAAEIRTCLRLHGRHTPWRRQHDMLEVMRGKRPTIEATRSRPRPVQRPVNATEDDYSELETTQISSLGDCQGVHEKQGTGSRFHVTIVWRTHSGIFPSFCSNGFILCFTAHRVSHHPSRSCF